VPRDQTGQRGSQGVDRNIGPRPTAPRHKRLVVLVEDCEEKGEGHSQSDVSSST
jgi:hypothetical protein